MGKIIELAKNNDYETNATYLKLKYNIQPPEVLRIYSYYDYPIIVEEIMIRLPQVDYFLSLYIGNDTKRFSITSEYIFEIDDDNVILDSEADSLLHDKTIEAMIEYANDNLHP
jgi:hypothetical protein